VSDPANILNAALKALDSGLRPIPIEANGKRPLLKWQQYQDREPTPEEVEGWFERWPTANLAILTGAASGVDVLDFDPGHDPWPTKGCELPTECIVRTPRGGQHYYVKHIVGVRNSAGKLAKGVDVRGDGGYAVIPPSIVNGKPYQYLTGTITEAGEAPGWLIKALRNGKASPPKPSATPAGAAIHEGQRNSALTSVAGAMRRKGMSEDAIRAALLEENRKRCSPPLEASEVEAIAKSVARYEPKARGFALTDMGNAARLVAAHGQDLRYCGAWGKWLVWDGVRWSPDDKLQVMVKAKAVALGIFDEAKAATDEGQRRDLGKWAMASQKRERLAAMVDLSRCELAIGADDLDRDRWLLNVLNGTVDLRTGELRDHRREDLMSKLAPVEYDYRAACARWESFLEEIMDGNSALISYLQRIAGMGLTGDVSEQVLFVFHGEGANGKSVLLDTLTGLLGDYACESPPDLLILRRSQEHPTELADLCGRRLVVACETEEGGRLRIERVKRLTGNARIKARFMRQDFFEFERTHKLVLMTNNKPTIREATHAIWRRIQLVPFAVTIPKDRQDRLLTEKLRAEWPGILAWAVRGCLDWQRKGLATPTEVERATETYRAEQDPLAEFFEEHCILEPNAFVSRADVFTAYNAWAEKQKERQPLDRRGLYDRLRKTPGVTEGQRRTGVESGPSRGFTGIGLRNAS